MRVPGNVAIGHGSIVLDSLNFDSIREIRKLMGAARRDSASCATSPRHSLRIQGARSKNPLIGGGRTDHALLKVIAEERINCVPVGANPVLPWVTPMRHLLFEALAQIDDREAASLVQNIGVGELLGLLEGIEEPARQTRMLTIEPCTHHHKVHGRKDPGLTIEPLV